MKQDSKCQNKNMKYKAGNRNGTAVRHFDYSLRGNTISSLVKKWAQKCKEREICHTLEISLLM